MRSNKHVDFGFAQKGWIWSSNKTTFRIPLFCNYKKKFICLKEGELECKFQRELPLFYVLTFKIQIVNKYFLCTKKNLGDLTEIAFLTFLSNSYYDLENPLKFL